MWAAEKAIVEAAARAKDDRHENELLSFFALKKCGVISCQGVGLSHKDTHAVNHTLLRVIYLKYIYFIIYEHPEKL